MRKFISVLLVTAIAVLGFSGPAFAEGEESEPAAPAVVEPAPEPEPEPPKQKEPDPPPPAPEPEPAPPAPEPEPQKAPEEPQVAPEDGRDNLVAVDPLGEQPQPESHSTAPTPPQSTIPVPPKKIHKSYVCKYVTKPGENEVLQTGNNPIWVDNSSLTGQDDSDVQVGDSFSDGQNRSVVIVANTEKLDPEPSIENCPPPNPPPMPEPLRETRPMETRDCEAGWARWTEERFSVPTLIDGVWVQVFSDNWTEVEGSRTVVDISDTDECQPPPPPPCPTTDPTLTSTAPGCPPLVVIVPGEWIDGVWVCGDTTVLQTRTVTTTTTPYILVDNQWVLDTENATVVVTHEQQTRELTQEEIGECPLLPGDIAAVCIGDVPYLQYGVDLPEGFIPDSENPVTITFVNPGGADYVVTGQPLNGTLLWPGASEGPPQMWPGWDTNDGGQTYFPVGDGNFGWSRNGVVVRFDVNPTYSTTVAYPEATAACANPPDNPDEPDNPDHLAFTGPSDTEGTIKLAGTLFLLGIGAVAVRRRWIV